MKKYEEENIFLSKVSFDTAMLVIVLVAGFFSIWIGQEGAAVRKQYASVVLHASAGQPVVTASLAASGKVTLDELYAASCALHTQLADDEEEGVCDAEGACQRSPEKLRKMCTFRIPNTKAFCNAGKYNQARMELINARNAMRDHVGLRTMYCRTNQIDCGIVIDRLGPAWVTEDDLTNETFGNAKKHLFSMIANLPPQDRLEPTAISIYAEIERRLATGKICD